MRVSWSKPRAALSFAFLCLIFGAGVFSPRAEAQVQYSVGDPTDDEQLLVELINRSRANANAEAQRLYHEDDPYITEYCSYYGVNMDQMTNQFTTLTQYAQPLSINEKLLAAARLHCRDMVTNRFVGHYSSSNCIPPNQPGDGPSERILRQGYNYAGNCGEACAARMDTIPLIHAGFEICWGGTNYGMYDPPYNRLSVHTASHREIGPGIAYDAGWGPYTVTADFAHQQTDTPFITGVAYYDVNSNSFYDAGEGLQGVRVNVAGATNYAVTGRSGGYSVPVQSNGSYLVTFSGAGFSSVVATVAVSDLLNQKRDFIPVYTPPVLVGPSNPDAGLTNMYSVGSFTSGTFRVRWTELLPGTWVEGAEDGTNHATIQASPGYDVIQPGVKAAGANAFHLAHPEPVSQHVCLERRIMPSSAGQLRFQSRLGVASTNQKAIVQISGDGRATWDTVYLQAGDTVGETSFAVRSVSLASYSNREVTVRFVYEFVSGSYYYQTNNGIGWYVDDISVSNSWVIGDVVETNIDTAAFAFCPASENDYLLQVQGRNFDRLFPFGAGVLVAAGPAMVVSFSELRPIPAGAQVEIRCHVDNRTPAGLALDEADQVQGPYSPLTLTPEDLGGGNFRYVYTPSNAPCKFLRARAQR